MSAFGESGHRHWSSGRLFLTRGGQRQRVAGNNNQHTNLCVIVPKQTKLSAWNWDARRNFSCRVQGLDRAKKKPSTPFERQGIAPPVPSLGYCWQRFSHRALPMLTNLSST